ncbi:MAG: YiiX/YebB-like N1pC/P60 family cysteine hydrolase [Planctomycetota bacterium]|nr:YiiX/YebB-like N1pC/P60 family cysteine hydrolase [Planctomycetota bacterium]
MTDMQLESHQRADIEAVTEIAVHLNQLRRTAEESLISTTVRDRGYFTPDEEDRVLANWGSYQQARAMLHEIIDAVAKKDRNINRIGITDFLIAYSAAILLVEAARFLRHYLSNEPAIRSKLNEAQPNLAIGEDAFEKIQRSLTAPANAIRIREAREFYETHQPEITKHVQLHPELSPLTELITERGAALEVSTARYVKSRIQDRSEQVTAALLQKGIANAIYGIQQIGAIAIGSLSTSPSHQPHLPENIAKEMKSLILRGDILITRKENALTNYFLPGFWPHSAFSIGEGRVIESMKDGVKNRSLDSTFQNDAMIVIRPNLSDSDLSETIERASKHIGKPYDFDFDFTRSDRMVCTEVIYRSFSGIAQIEFPLSKRAGRHTLSAEDLLRKSLTDPMFNIVAGFHPKASDCILEHAEAKALVEKTLGKKQMDWSSLR